MACVENLDKIFSIAYLMRLILVERGKDHFPHRMSGLGHSNNLASHSNPLLTQL